MADYIEAMRKKKISGLDITVLILCHMFDLTCVVLLEDIVWKSSNIPIEEFDVFLLMMSGGRFVSATRNDGCKLLLSIPPCAQNVIEEHENPGSLKGDSTTDAESDDVHNSGDDLNMTDTMIAQKDAFSGRNKILPHQWLCRHG